MCEQSYSKQDLDNFLKELLGITTIPFLIQRQIREYITERGWNYKGIARAIAFLVDKRGQNFREFYQQYGIGMIKSNNGEPYYAAQKYFEKLKQEQERQEERQQAIIIDQQTPTVFIYCGLADSKKKSKRKSIDISSL